MLDHATFVFRRIGRTCRSFVCFFFFSSLFEKVRYSAVLLVSVAVYLSLTEIKTCQFLPTLLYVPMNNAVVGIVSKPQAGGVESNFLIYYSILCFAQLNVTIPDHSRLIFWYQLPSFLTLLDGTTILMSKNRSIHL